MLRRSHLVLAMLLVSLPAAAFAAIGLSSPVEAVGPVLDHGGQPLSSPVVAVGPVLDHGGQPPPLSWPVVAVGPVLDHGGQRLFQCP
jgi:hypothetical protein